MKSNVSFTVQIVMMQSQIHELILHVAIKSKYVIGTREDGRAATFIYSTVFIVKAFLVIYCISLNSKGKALLHYLITQFLLKTTN